MSKTQRHCPQAPLSYDPDFRLWANCYSYALGIPNLRTEKPGYLKRSFMLWSGYTYGMNVNGVDQYLCNDGLVRIREHEEETRPVLAAFLKNGDDFHFYRRHTNGTWSHKLPFTTAMMDDWKGRTITDPRYVDRGGYDDFVGFYKIPAEGIEFLPSRFSFL